MIISIKCGEALGQTFSRSLVVALGLITAWSAPDELLFIVYMLTVCPEVHEC